MDIAESAAAFVLGDPQEAYYTQHQDSRINIHAPEWIPTSVPASVHASVAYQNPLDFQIAEAKRNLTHAFACARHAQKIAEDATIAAKIATDSAFSASQSVEKAASILRDLQRMYDYPVLPVQRTSVSAVNTSLSPVPSATVRAISAAIRAVPITARVARPIPIVAPKTIPATGSQNVSQNISQKVQRDENKPPSTSPIVAPVKLRRGTNDCFNKQQSLPCKPYNGKACRYCK
jgi:hypothetical protein